MLLFENLVLDDCLVQAIEDGKISSSSFEKIGLANKVRGVEHIKVVVTLNNREDWRTLYEKDFDKVKGNYSFTAAGELKVYVITTCYKKNSKSNFEPFHNSSQSKGNHVSIDTFIANGFHSSVTSLF